MTEKPIQGDPFEGLKSDEEVQAEIDPEFADQEMIEKNTENGKKEEVKIEVETEEDWEDNFAAASMGAEEKTKTPEDLTPLTEEESINTADFKDDVPEPEDEGSMLDREEKQQYAKLNPQERQQFIEKHAPVLEPEDFKTADGRMVDFNKANTIEELVRMVGQEETITNGLGEEVDSERMINMIYDRVLNRNDYNRDWTKITLRHRLRETVYRLAEEYMTRPEYQGLAGLNLQDVGNAEQLMQIVREREQIIDASGKTVNGATLAHYMEIGRYDLVPVPLRYKLNELLKQEVAQKPTWKKAFSRVTSWFRR